MSPGAILMISRHLLHSEDNELRQAKKNVDNFGDSYYEDVSALDVKAVWSDKKFSFYFMLIV